MIKRIAIFAYGMACYLLFLVTFLYAAGFVGNILVPKSIDSPATMPFGQALLIDIGLLALFALQHSIMARQGFKQVWIHIVPEPAERSTYVLFSSLALMLLFWMWQPLGGVVWQMESPAATVILQGVFALGLLIVLVSTFLINHFDLFGLRQVTLFLVDRPYTHAQFSKPFFYKYVRHPLYLGWLLFFWSTPVMTGTHLFFACMTTGYILIAIQFEERDLVRMHGNAYRRYQQEVPMILPYPTAVETSSGATAGQAAR
jgi:methanethiol S-methyltransferase